MKKIITWILLAAMLLGMFAGCGKSEDPTQPSTAPVEIPNIEATEGENNAADVTNYLKGIYKDSGAKTAGNFQRFGIVRIAGVPYEVVWTVDVSEDLVKIIVNDDGTVTIDVNEKCPEDTIYTLTATVTDDNGNVSTATWEYLLPGTASLEEMQATVDEAYALDVGAAMTEERVLSGVIKSIDSPWSDQYQNISVVMLVEGRESKPILCYRLKGEGAKDLVPGDTITVQGIIKNYKGTIEFDAGCQLVTVEKTGTPVEMPSDPHEIMEDVYALGRNEALPYGPVTLTGPIISIDEAYTEQYKNITVTIRVDWYTIKCYRMTGAGVENLEMNDIITVQGYIKNYNGTREFDKPTLLNVVKVGAYPQPTDPVEVVQAAYNLDAGWTLPYSPVTLTGTVTKVNSSWSDKYGNVTVTMVVEGAEKLPIECYRMKLPANASKEMKAAVKTLEKGDQITVEGMLIKYQNMTSGKTKVEFNAPELVSLVKAEKEVSDLSATLTTSLKTGDKVVIAAPAYSMALSSEYNGFYNKGTPVTISNNVVKGFFAADVWTVTANADGSYCFSIGGQKLSMDTGYTSMPLGKVNDTWTLEEVSTGIYKVKNVGRGNYIEWYAEKNNWSSYYNANSDLFELSFYKFEGELDPVPGSTLTVSEAIALGASKDHDEYTDGKYYVTGEITEIYNTKYGNMRIKDSAGNILTIYGTYDSTGANRFDAMTTKPAVGDTVKLYGIIGQYNGTPQMENGWIMEINGNSGNEGGSGSGSGTTSGSPLVLTVDSMSIASQTYYTGAATVGGIGFDLTQIGNYGNGIQMRDNDKGTSILFNTTAMPGKITKIELTFSGSKSTYNNADAVIFSFGESKDNLTYTTKLSTVAGTKTYTITPNGDFKFFKLEHDVSFTFYWDSIAIHYDNAGGGSSGGTTPPVTPEEPVAKEGTIAQALAATEGELYKVKGVVTLLDSKNVYMQDSTGGICVRMSSAPTDLSVGDTIIGTGSRLDYNGLPQLDSGTYEKSSGMTLSAKETTIGALTTADICTYVTIKDVTVTEVYDNNGQYSTPNITVEDEAGNTIQIYKAAVGKTNGAWDVKVGNVLTVTGAVGCNKGKLQLRNTNASEIVVTSQGDAEEDDDNSGSQTPPATGGAKYIKVTSASEFTTGKYVMVVSTGYAPQTLSGSWVLAGKPTVGDGVITTDNASGYIWNIAVNGNSATLTDANGVSIAPASGNNNGIKSGSYNWAWAFSGGTFTFNGVGTDTNRLASNKSSSGQFRAYKTTTISGQSASYPCDFTLYKLVE